MGALDERIIEMWQNAEREEFCSMLPEYAAKGHGEGFMHDTAMLLGALGWSKYDGNVEVLTPYFASAGTGQINAFSPSRPRTDPPCQRPMPQIRLPSFPLADLGLVLLLCSHSS
ncbi:3,4-dihydroxyphenylacetate 2,3-dioxygenase [compost metagenome]